MMKIKYALPLGVLAATGLYALASVAQTNTTVKVASAGIASDIGFFIADKQGLFPRRRARRSAHADGQFAANDRAARHGAARRWRWHGRRWPLQRRLAEHRDPRRRRH